MMYKVTSHWQLPTGTKEWWSVVVRWDSTKRYFSTREEAESYARSRIDKLLAHPTGGPKVNGMKDPNPIVEWEEWQDQSDSWNGEQFSSRPLLRGMVGTMLLQAPWWFGGHYSVMVEHYTSKNGVPLTEFNTQAG